MTRTVAIYLEEANSSLFGFNSEEGESGESVMEEVSQTVPNDISLA